MGLKLLAKTFRSLSRKFPLGTDDPVVRWLIRAGRVYLAGITSGFATCVLLAKVGALPILNTPSKTTYVCEIRGLDILGEQFDSRIKTLYKEIIAHQEQEANPALFDNERELYKNTAEMLRNEIAEERRLFSDIVKSLKENCV